MHLIMLTTLYKIFIIRCIKSTSKVKVNMILSFVDINANVITASFKCNGLFYWVKCSISNNKINLISHTCDFDIDKNDIIMQIKGRISDTRIF